MKINSGNLKKTTTVTQPEAYTLYSVMIYEIDHIKIESKKDHSPKNNDKELNFKYTYMDISDVRCPKTWVIFVVI